MTRLPKVLAVGAVVVCCGMKALLVAGVGVAAASAALSSNRAWVTAAAAIVATASLALLSSFARWPFHQRCEAGR